MAPSPAPELKPWLEGVSFGPDGSFANMDAAKGMLDFMVSHDTGSSHDPNLCKSNVPFIKALRESLDELGLKTATAEEEFPPGSGIMQASLVARMGPENVKGGVVLSSHTDVIPVGDAEKGNWKTDDPFRLSESIPGRLTARGAVDMKQAIVNYMAIAQAYHNKQGQLEKPVYLALSWGEEIGIKGVPAVNRLLKEMNADPDLIIVGEPTDEQLVIGHKGTLVLQVNVQGKGGHSGYPENFIDAGIYAAQIKLAVQALQKRYIEQSKEEGSDFNDPAYNPPYPCVNLGVMRVGTAPNAVADSGTLEICARSTDKIPIERIMADIRGIIEREDRLLKLDAKALARTAGTDPDPNIGITYQELSHGAGLTSQEVPEKRAMLERVTHGLAELGRPDAKFTTESYCTDGGALAQEFPHATTVVFGTGNIKTQHAHNPDEYILPEQLQRGPMFPLRMIYECCLPHERNYPDAWMMPSALGNGRAAEAQLA